MNAALIYLNPGADLEGSTGRAYPFPHVMTSALSKKNEKIDDSFVSGALLLSTIPDLPLKQIAFRANQVIKGLIWMCVIK